MSWGDVISLAAGGLHGYEQQSNADEKLDLDRKREELRLMVEQLRQDHTDNRLEKSLGSKERVAGATNTSREKIAGETNQTRSDIAGQASADRVYGIDTRSADSRYGVDTRSSDTERGQDLESGHWLASDLTTRRGQNMSAETQRRAQDLTAGTATANRDASSGARAEQYALEAYKADVANRKAEKPSLFGAQTPEPPIPSYEDWLKTSADPEIFPSVRRAHAPAPAPMQSPAGADRGMPPPAAAAPVTTPTARPAAPVPPRAAATTPAPTAAAPKGLAPGATVVLKSGKRVTVTKINPDGTFVYQ